MTKEQQLEYHAALMRLANYNDPGSGRGRKHVRINVDRDRDLVAHFRKIQCEENDYRNLRYKIQRVLGQEARA